MKRIQVIGCGGAGKSTLSIKLGAQLGLQVHHLDTLFWKPGWQESTQEEFAGKLSPILASSEWVMDGNYGGTMEWRINESDTVIFLDFPTWVCLSGAIWRRFAYWGKSRPDMTEGNLERLERRFLLWILNYRRNRRPHILAMLERHKDNKRIVILKSRAEVEQFLQGVRK